MESPLGSVQGTKRERTRDELLISTQALLRKFNAAELRISQITEHAGLVHASFYNYYRDVSALFTDLGELLGATHAIKMAQLVSSKDSPSTRFARITRETLLVVAQQPFFGRLMFDVGLPMDQLGGNLRRNLHLDIAQGVALGIFDATDIEVAVSLVSGSIQGLALDIHRGVLPAAKIDTATARLLVSLGVEAAEAERLAFTPLSATPRIQHPMRWLALPITA